MKNKRTILLYPLLSSILFFLSSLDFSFSFICLFFAFVPLLELENLRAKQQLGNRLFYLLIYSSLVLTNLAGLAWMAKLGVLNMVIIALIYSLFFLPSFYFYARAKYLNATFSYLIFALSWFSIEYIHVSLDWGLPIQVLGYGFANNPAMIQWYEYTGVFGGTLWALLINVLLFNLWKEYRSPQGVNRKIVIGFTAILILPIISSLLMMRDTGDSQANSVKVMSIHSNLDCYSEKYQMPVDSILDYYYQLIRENYSEDIDLVILPENAVTSLEWVEDFNTGQNKVITSLKRFREQLQLKNLIVGGIAYEITRDRPKENPLASYIENINEYALMYNMVLCLNKDKMDFRTKEKLVPFEETHPFPHFKNWTLFLYDPLGGFTFSVRKGNKDNLLIDDKFKLGAMICYESAYGSMARRMVNKGAQLLSVMLNEGWYDSFEGSRKFLNLSRVRAIETRRAVIRSSNRGISSLVDLNGNEIATRNRVDEGVLIQEVPLSKELTFYTQIGYLLIKGLFFLFFPLLLFSILKSYLVKKA